jgi:hypothetical protein
LAPVGTEYNCACSSTLEHDQQLHDLSAACVIAHQYSSSVFFSFMHAVLKYIIFLIFSLFLLRVKFRDLKLCKILRVLRDYLNLSGLEQSAVVSH